MAWELWQVAAKGESLPLISSPASSNFSPPLTGPACCSELGMRVGNQTREEISEMVVWDMPVLLSGAAPVQLALLSLPVSFCFSLSGLPDTATWLLYRSSHIQGSRAQVPVGTLVCFQKLSS